MTQRAYLKRQARLDLVGEHVGNCLVEVGQDAHGQLWLDAALGDQRVEPQPPGSRAPPQPPGGDGDGDDVCDGDDRQ